MRLFFSFILAIFVNIAMAFISVEVVPQANDLDHGCEHNGYLYSIGESWNGENCTKMTCDKLNETDHIISTYGCGVAIYNGLGDSCKLVYPPNSVGYPECCKPTIMCT